MTRVHLCLVMAAVAALALTACADFRAVGKAAVRELTADAVNVERAAFISAAKKYEKVQVADAQPTPSPAPAPAASRSKKKGDQKKGIWEKK